MERAGSWDKSSLDLLVLENTEGLSTDTMNASDLLVAYMDIA